MAESAEAARRELVEALGRGLGSGFAPPLELPSDRELRRSAVLILFGVLDRVPADRPAAAVAGELDVLLTRRASGLRTHAGEIAFPGGGVEAGDADRAATALREAQEETGLDPGGVDVLGSLPVARIPVSNNLVTPVLGWWRRPSEVDADHRESVEVFRVPVAELLDPAARGTATLRRGRLTHRSPAFRLGPRFGGHIVWGFTGILLSGIFDGLGWAVPWDGDRTFELEARDAL
ncbi:CoA pyrophosphatase [Leucobacter weissii]|uniref:CoA pyrophosphatase n=1 Tax=Leucobacter weissii TaxID=1983706 RepID=A0A939MMV1_9MICO|nr:CoA pyrophosphatase [Leucobacter weissii]MBO1901697.1 CoA pyrophosphatase [Leucobacter weissii]